MIHVIYSQEPTFPATDQAPSAIRYRVGRYIVDASGPAPTQDEVDRILRVDLAGRTERARLNTIDATIASDTTIAALKAMTSQEFDDWWASNVTTAAQAIAVLKRLARVVIRRVL